MSLGGVLRLRDAAGKDPFLASGVSWGIGPQRSKAEDTGGWGGEVDCCFRSFEGLGSAWLLG